MSIKYDLLDEQIEAVQMSIMNAQLQGETVHHITELRGVLQLLEYIKSDKCNCNLNEWEDESDCADNEFTSF